MPVESDVHDSIIESLEQKLSDRLRLMGDVESLAILSDIAATRRVKHLLLSTNGHDAGHVPFLLANPPFANAPHAPTANGNGQSSKGAPRMLPSKCDVAIDLIRKAGHPLHVNSMLPKLPEYGITGTKKESFVSLLAKDRRRRFIRTGPNTFDIDEQAITATMQARFASLRGGVARLLPEGFSLTGSIKTLVSKMDGEFDQPSITNLLRDRYPDAAERIQNASVSSTLKILAKQGFLEITYKGRGPNPTRYRRAGALFQLAGNSTVGAGSER